MVIALAPVVGQTSYNLICKGQILTNLITTNKPNVSYISRITFILFIMFFFFFFTQKTYFQQLEVCPPSHLIPKSGQAHPGNRTQH